MNDSMLDIITDKLVKEEFIKESIRTYYKFENGLPGLGGIGRSSSPHIPGVLVSTNLRILFYSEVNLAPVFVEIDKKDIISIKEKKDQFALFKFIPIMVISQLHKDREVFTEKGDLTKHEKLKVFFENLKSELPNLKK